MTKYSVKMGEYKESNLNFVLRYYKKGRLDTDKVVSEFRKRTTSGTHKSNVWNIFRYSTAAAIAAVVIGIVVFMGLDSSKWTESVTADAVMTVVLPDSSEVVLAPYSSVSYKNAKSFCKNRQVKLSGKAFFSIMKDTGHPFEVTSDRTYVKVLGTQFQVSDYQDNSYINVISGKVFFAAGKESEGVVLTKGMNAHLKSGMEYPELTKTKILNPAAWATGIFRYESAPVSDVLDELSTYYGVTLKIHESPASVKKRLTGTFFAEDISKIVSAIEDALDVKIERI